MRPPRSVRTLALAIALAAVAVVLVAAAQAGTSSRSGAHAATGAGVALRKTTLGTILVDSRGRTLYLFEKDTNAMVLAANGKKVEPAAPAPTGGGYSYGGGK